jgi:nitrogen fixation NifU-like protein
MSNDFADELQEKILKEIRERYSPIVIEHWQNPRNWGIMNNPDGYAKITGPCGDTMEISIKLKDNKIEKCTFDTDGCGASVACASIITEMATRKTVAEARQMSQVDVMEFCGGLPEEDRHCALLAVDTLQQAVGDCQEKGNQPWKRPYRVIR